MKLTTDNTSRRTSQSGSTQRSSSSRQNERSASTHTSTPARRPPPPPRPSSSRTAPPPPPRIANQLQSVATAEQQARLYKPENFYFATQRTGKLPTLYFSNAEGSGRLRQEHAQGTLASPVLANTQYLFFADRKNQDAFFEAFKGLYQQTQGRISQEQYDALAQSYGATNAAYTGAYVVESSIGNGSLNVHPSGGRVLSPEDGASLSQNAEAIFQQVR